MTICPFLDKTRSNDVDLEIIYHVDNFDDLISLSRVNKKAFQILANQTFFKDFLHQYAPFELWMAPECTLARCSLISALDMDFFTLHPSSYKIVCCILIKNRITIPATGYKQAMPFLIATLAKPVLQRENSLTQICGGYYQDPNSPIHQAWQEYENVLHELNNLQKDYDYFRENEIQMFELCERTSDEYLTFEIKRKIITQKIIKIESTLLKGNNLSASKIDSLKKKKLNLETKLQKICGNGYQDPNSPIHQAWVADAQTRFRYLSATKHSKDYLALEEAAITRLNFYKGYESKRQRLVQEIAVLNKDIELLKNEKEAKQCGQSAYNYFLEDTVAESIYEIRHAIKNHQTLITDLEEICRLIQEEILSAIPNKERCENIQNLINSLSEGKKNCISRYVWQTLFDCCSSNVKEDKWAEVHFADHLPVFLHVIQEVITKLQRYQSLPDSESVKIISH